MERAQYQMTILLLLLLFSEVMYETVCPTSRPSQAFHLFRYNLESITGNLVYPD